MTPPCPAKMRPDPHGLFQFPLIPICPFPGDRRKNILQAPAAPQKTPDGALKGILLCSARSPRVKNVQVEQAIRPLSSLLHHRLLRSPGSRPAAPRTVFTWSGLHSFLAFSSFRDIPPRRNRASTTIPSKNSGNAWASRNGSIFVTTAFFTPKALNILGTGSSRRQDGSRCRLRSPCPPIFPAKMGGFTSWCQRRGPGSALRALETVLLPQTWRLVPGYSMPPPRGTDGVQAHVCPVSKIPLLPRELLRVPSGNLRGVLLPPASLRSSALMG